MADTGMEFALNGRNRDLCKSRLLRPSGSVYDGSLEKGGLKDRAIIRHEITTLAEVSIFIHSGKRPLPSNSIGEH
jgi:hypothetical protein